MGKRWQRVAVCALIAIGSTIAGMLLSAVDFFEVLNAKTYDAHFVLQEKFFGPRPTHDIILITADEKAQIAFPEPMLFWQEHYADMIRGAQAGGAKVMALDIAFGLPVKQWMRDRDPDQTLAEAAVTASSVADPPMPVVVAYVPGLNRSAEAGTVPINIMAGGLGLGAFPNLTTDPVDDYIRRQELLEVPSGNEPPAHSLALLVVEKFLGAEADFHNGILTVAGRRIPIDQDRSIYINYAGGPRTFPRVSMAEVDAALKAHRTDQLKQWFKGKIVLLGTDFKGDSDRKNTPLFAPWISLSNLSDEDWSTAGVEIHANTVQTLLDQNYPRPAPFWLRAVAGLAAAAATMAAAALLAVSSSVPALLAIGLIVALTTHFFLMEMGIILSTSETMVGSTICLIGAIIFRYFTAEKRGDLFHQAVSLFVSKKMAASLENASGLGLSGKRQTVTILFTDIRGFTAYSEQVCEEHGPEFLVKKLNEYLATMAGIIVVFGGHVNKYIGDGILAVFSDDDEGSVPGDHALRCVECATRMVNATSEFKTGAGIHTGEVVVGNVGSADKMEYTVLGDTVNLASRLESLNKEHKTKLLMSDTTQRALGGKIETTNLGSVPVRGKAEPIELYTVTSLLTEAGSKATPKEVSHA